MGGGGDIIALSAKIELLDNVLADEETVSFDFLDFFPNIDFEPIYGAKAKGMDQVEVEYVAEAKTDPRAPAFLPITDARVHYEERIIIYVSADAWEKGKADRDALLKKMREMVTGIFPVNPLVKTRTRMVEGCDKKALVAFPKTHSSAAYIIQYLRVGLRQNCKKVFGLGDRVSYRIREGD